MSDEDLLRAGLRTLTADQPWAPDRVTAVSGRVRRRRQQRLAVSASALAVVGVAAAVALVPSGPTTSPTPARPEPGSLTGLDWEPRGDLVDDVGAAASAWQPGVADPSVRVLFAGGLSSSALTPGADTRDTADRWYVLQGRVGSAERLAVVRDRDGEGPAAYEVLVDQPAPRASADQVTALLTDVPAGLAGTVWQGKDGVRLRSLLFVLPRPGAEGVTAVLRDERDLTSFRSLPAGPSLTEVDTPVGPVGLLVDGSRTVRAELPLVEPEPRLDLPPPVSRDDQVEVIGSTGAGSVTGKAFSVPFEVLVRCTTRGGPLTVAVITPSETRTAEQVPCDGASSSAVGPVEPVDAGGVSDPRLPAGDGFGVLVESSPGVDQIRISVVVARGDLAAVRGR